MDPTGFSISWIQEVAHHSPDHAEAIVRELRKLALKDGVLAKKVGIAEEVFETVEV
jgi:hypothetical protein